MEKHILKLKKPMKEQKNILNKCILDKIYSR